MGLELALQEQVEYPIVKMLQQIAQSALKGRQLSWFRPLPSNAKLINEGSGLRSSQVGNIVKPSRKSIASRSAQFCCLALNYLHGFLCLSFKICCFLVCRKYFTFLTYTFILSLKIFS